MKTLASLLRQPALVDGEGALQPMVTRDEGAARRLGRTADQIARKKFCQSSLKLGFRVGFAVGREKESRPVGFALNAPRKGRAIVEKKMPIALLVQRQRLCTAKQQLKVGLSAVLAAGCVWQKTQNEKRDTEDHR